MMPPVFKTESEYKHDRLVQEIIVKDITTGGKFWCWHDYTFIHNTYPIDGFEMMKGVRYCVGCVKCGKKKRVANLPIEPINRIY